MESKTYKLILYTSIGVYTSIKIMELLTDPSKINIGNLFQISLPFILIQNQMELIKILKDRNRKFKK